MECFICGCSEEHIDDEDNQECKLFSVGKTEFFVCFKCLTLSDPEKDFEDVKDLMRLWQKIRKKILK